MLNFLVEKASWTIAILVDQSLNHKSFWERTLIQVSKFNLPKSILDVKYIWSVTVALTIIALNHKKSLATKKWQT